MHCSKVRRSNRIKEKTDRSAVNVISNTPSHERNVNRITVPVIVIGFVYTEP